MNLKQIPIIATPLALKDFLQVFKLPFLNRPSRDIFSDQLKEFFNSGYCCLTYSGRTAAYVILKVLSRMKNKKEVIIPAYVCASLVGAIKKANLKVKLCDISLDTFQIDTNSLKNTITDDTLCIIPAHLFGLACDMDKINTLAREKNIEVVEDFAQSMGTQISGKESGTLSKVGFSSFGRGKNFTTYSGGVLTTDDEEFFSLLKKEINQLDYPSVKERAGIYLRLLIFYSIINPYIHRAFHKLILFLKGEDYPIFDLKASQYTDFQAAIASSVFKRFNLYRKKRYENGMLLYEKLKSFNFLRLPKILPNSRPAFNRLPVLFSEKSLREKCEKELLRAGIIACRLYTKPLRWLYPDLCDGCEPDSYPNANIFAQNSLTLPTHPLVNEKIIDKIIEVFGKL